MNPIFTSWYRKKNDFGNVMPKVIPNFIKSYKIFGDEVSGFIKKFVLVNGKLSLTLKFNL